MKTRDPSAPKAETIAQLLNQLESQGYDADALGLINRAYDLTLSLGTCQYRSSGRTLIDHSVGVASLLAALGLPVTLVAAGVVHASYVHGDFGTVLKRVDARKRARVRRAVGADVDEIILGYARLDRNVRRMPAIQEQLRSLDAKGRQLLLLRLVDLLDLYGARDVLYCDNVADRREIARTLASSVTQVAADLGFPSLAAALARGFAEVREGVPSAAPTTPVWKDGVLVPRSHRIRPTVAIYQRARSKLYAWIGR